MPEGYINTLPVVARLRAGVHSPDPIAREFGAAVADRLPSEASPRHFNVAAEAVLYAWRAAGSIGADAYRSLRDSVPGIAYRVSVVEFADAVRSDFEAFFPMAEAARVMSLPEDLRPWAAGATERPLSAYGTMDLAGALKAAASRGG